jgi:hypothetical protein
MKTRSVETALALLGSVQLVAATPDFSGAFKDSPAARTNLPPALASTPSQSPGGASNYPIQQIVLDPLQVIHVPVATDRLTTLRFPSPVSYLASALISTEAHPNAHFQMTFHPGESFFSVRALRAKASTTLNVVWKSQTFVFDFQESPNPWLSVILTSPPPARPERPPFAAARSLQETSQPSDRYLDTARNFTQLKKDYPRSLTDVDRVETAIHRQFNGVSLRVTEVLHFKSDRVGVARVVFSNRGGAPVDLGSRPIELRHQGQPLRLLGSDFNGIVPPFGAQTALVAFQFPSGEAIRDPSALQVIVPALEPNSARTSRPTLFQP